MAGGIFASPGDLHKYYTDLKTPKPATNFYGTPNGVSVPAGRGLRPIGPTPTANLPVPYEAPVRPAAPAPSLGVRMLPAGTTPPNLPGSGALVMAQPRGFTTGGSSFQSAGRGMRPPAPRAQIGYTPAGGSANLPIPAERGFTLNGSPYGNGVTNVTAKTLKAPLQIGYRPGPGPGVEGMGDFAQYATNTGKAAKAARGLGIGGVLRGVARTLMGPEALAVQALAAPATMQANATENSNGPTIGVRRTAPVFALGPGRSYSTNAVSYTDPRTGDPVSVTQSRNQTARQPTLSAGVALDDSTYYNAGRGGSAADAMARDNNAAAAARVAPHPSAGRGVRRRVAATAPVPQPVPVNEPTVTSDPITLASDNAAYETPEKNRGYIESGGVRYYVPGSQEFDGVGGIEAQPATQVAQAPQMTTYGDSTGVYQLAQGQAAPRDWSKGTFADAFSAKMNSQLGLRGAQTAQAEASARRSDVQSALETEAQPVELEYKRGLTRESKMRTDVNYWKAPSEIAATEAQAKKSLADANETELLAPKRGAYLDAQTGEVRFDTQAKKEKLPLEKVEIQARITKMVQEGALTSAQAKVMSDEQKLKIAMMQDETKRNAPEVKADLDQAALDAGSTGMLPSEVVAAKKAGYREKRGVKKHWFSPDEPAGMFNEAGERYTGQAAVPAGYKPTGKLSTDGKPVYVGPDGKNYIL